MFGRYSAERYHYIESHLESLEEELEALLADYRDTEEEAGEEEAEALYGEDIAELEQEIEDCRGELGATEYHWLEQEYYASVL